MIPEKRALYGPNPSHARAVAGAPRVAAASAPRVAAASAPR